MRNDNNKGSISRRVSRSLLSVAISAALLGNVAPAFGQSTDGSVRGTIAGANQSTIVQVVDTARGTTRSSTIDGSGEFRVDGLAPGQYEVRVLQGGSVVDTVNVSVSLGGATRVNMATSAAQIQEIVTTGRRLVALDTSIAESGLVISSDVLLDLPVRRDLTSVALLAPGTSLGDNRFGGNSNSASGNLAAFGGASVAENTSFINGLNTTNFRTGVGFSQVPFEFYDSLQIKTGGYSAKYGRSTGGVMNTTTKRGSNEWDFGVNLYYDDEISTAPNTYAAANDLDKKEKQTADVYLSGPIIQDRLFFYALYSDVNDKQRYAGTLEQRDYDYNVDEGFWGIKLDGYITPDHHVEFTAFSDERTGVESVYGFDPVTFARGASIGDTIYEEGGRNWIATYNGNFGDNLRMSISYGENEANRTEAPASSAIPTVYEFVPGSGLVPRGDWANFTVSEGDDLREMSRIDFTWTGFANHELSFGYDNEDNFSSEATTNSGGVYWLIDPSGQYFGCAPANCPAGGASVRKRTYETGGSFETNSKSYYIQDVWTVNDRLTLELGLRNETFRNLNSAGGIFVEVKDQWAPRLAAVFDPTGEGRSKIFANYGQYYLPIAANTNIRMAGNELFLHEFYAWDGVSKDAQFQPTGLGAPYNTVVLGDGSVPDTRSLTDANLKAMYQDEYILGYQTSIDAGYGLGSLDLGVKGIYRSLGATIEDVAIDAAVIDYYNSTGTWRQSSSVESVFGGFHQYVLTNPGSDMRVFIPEQDEFINLTAAQLNYPKAKRTYEAIEFTVGRPFDGKWSADLSYTWSKSEGNHEGYVKSDNAQDDAGITQNFDQPGLVDNSFGRLPNDRPHTIKAWGSYQINDRFLVGANYLIQSGRPISCFGLHPTDVFAQAYAVASHFCGGEAVQRGSLGRTPSITTLDLNLQYSMAIGGTDVRLSMDIFNVFDSDKKIRVNENGDTAGGLAEPNFLRATSFQMPRSLRLSARFNFL
jgi:outer membrane receptor protein involved in Fe transport